jgi:UTP-glucose-1-phosphate uridylyltransferase
MTHCSSRIPVSLVILAAGLGRRFGGNKQLATLGDTGKSLMYFSVLDAYRAGVRHLVIVINRNIERAIVKQFLPLLPGDLEVSLVRQRRDNLPAGCKAKSREKPWGTGHALWCARSAVPADFIVINADDYYGSGAMNQLLSHFEKHSGWAMVSYQLGKILSNFGVVNRGLCEESNGFLLAVRECHSIEEVNGVIRGEIDSKPVTLAPEAPVSMNIWGFGPDIFACLEKGLTGFFAGSGNDPQAEYYLPAQVMASIRAGENRVRVYNSLDSWHGITYREDLERLAGVFSSMREQVFA